MQNIINDKSLVLGVMSGTSMDGLDISCARYYQKKNKWKFDLLDCKTFNYNNKIKSDLIKTFHNDYDLSRIDVEFAHIISDYINLFIKEFNLKIDLISSHGHTIFHNPKNNYTKQIGLGSVIAKQLSIPVVSNFRQQDIDLGGQGAPLVPIGDKLLFSEYNSCLNLGGIANISFNSNNNRYAYDICPCNMILNFLSQKIGQDFDKFGDIGSKGQVNTNLFNKLNSIEYYSLNIPKSLGKEYIDVCFLPIINSYNIHINDLMCTVVEHIAFQISNTLLKFNISNTLVSGGGAFNNYLISRILYFSESEIIIPSSKIINFKEAIVFGFLGVLRLLYKNNCLASATGADKDHSSGDIYLV